MKTPRRLTFTVTWDDGPGQSVSFDWRPWAAILLCGFCYTLGRWQAGVENAPLSRGKGLVLASAIQLPEERTRPAGIVATQGSAEEDQRHDIITPLNVRDASALVMGPAPEFQVPPTAEPPPVPSKPVREIDWRDQLRDESQ